MAFPARFAGTCSKCNQPIEAKIHFITWSCKHRGQAYHFDCNEPTRVPDDYKVVETGPTSADATTVKSAAANGNSHDAGAELINIIRKVAESSVSESDVERIAGKLFADLLAQQPEPDAKEITVKQANKPDVKLTGNQHEAFEEVLLIASQRIPVLLIGPAGCGKSHLAAQIAKALNLRFGSISCSAGMTEGHLTGRLLPTAENGRFEYQVSQFVDFYENGGVFLLDEIDAADSNTLLVINQATANGHIPVPNRVENPVATRHADFILIAAANTFGTGANRLYVGRNQLDESTLDRFRVGQVLMDYDERL